MSPQSHGQIGKASMVSSSDDIELGPHVATNELKEHERRTENDGRTPANPTVPQEQQVSKLLRSCVIRLMGHIFFASIPSLEYAFTRTQKACAHHHIIVLDMSQVCRVETAAAEFLERTFQDIASSTLFIIAGVSEESAVHADLQRGGLPVDFEPHHVSACSKNLLSSNVIAFESLVKAVEWINLYAQMAPHSTYSLETASIGADPDFTSDEDASEAFNRLFPAEALLQPLLPSTPEVGEINSLLAGSAPFQSVKAAGGQIRRYERGQSISIPESRVIFIVQGEISIDLHKRRPSESLRPSLQALVRSCVRRLYSATVTVFGKIAPDEGGNATVKRCFGPGKSIAVVQARFWGLAAGEAPSHSDHLEICSANPPATMDRFVIAPEVTKMLPKMQVVIVVAYNLNNTGENPAITKFCQETATSTLSSLSAYPNAQSHPRVALYRTTLKAACNLSPKKFPQSHESLYKRLLKEKTALRPINPLVDFYNAVSIKHGVTAGAFDLGALQTRSTAPLELRLSTAQDTFKALDAGAEEAATPVPEGELVYAQGTTVLTRHLAWRQAVEGLVTEATKDVIFMSEVFHEDEGEATGGAPSTLSAGVADELVGGLKRFFGADAKATVLGMGMGVESVDVENAFF
ncbi:MAG: hypothetical protein Q9208_008534 [Pyrenodesmia sp. 3 TL-2023]